MKIINHMVEGATLSPIAGGKPMKVRRCLVWHATAGASGASSITAMKEAGTSAHIVVERDGSIIQCRPFNVECAHAGKSRWQDPRTGKRYGSANSYGIGIEICNALADRDALKWAKARGARTRMAKHPNGGPIQEWEEYTDEQIQTVMILSMALVKHYQLDDALGHEQCAPERRNDPGPCFPIEAMREACGFGRTRPKVHWL